MPFELPATIVFNGEAMPLKCFYKGEQLEVCNGMVVLPKKEKIEPPLFSVVIAKHFSFETDGKLVRRLKRISGVPCLWYDITLCRCDEKGKDCWCIKKRPLDEVPLALHDRVIVLQVAPHLVRELRECVANISDDLIYLPTVVFKKDLDKKVFENAFTEAALDTDLDAIHRKAGLPHCLIKGTCLP